jgi:hypothetical protein
LGSLYPKIVPNTLPLIGTLIANLSFNSIP